MYGEGTRLITQGAPGGFDRFMKTNNWYTGYLTCTTTADGPIRNVTLFIPVPDTRDGASPIVSEYSSQTMKGLPEGWKATLFGTGKGTLVKLTEPGLATAPYTISISANLTTDRQIETADPVADGVMFRPLQNAKKILCEEGGHYRLPGRLH